MKLFFRCSGYLFSILCIFHFPELIQAESESSHPNIVIILSDDQAWNDYGFMGHDTIKTPALDKLASESAVFKRGYVPVSLCRPSLMTVITGLYPHQHKITGNDPPKGMNRQKLLKHVKQADCLPEMLGKIGYQSFQTGKWWEGNPSLAGFTSGMTHGDPSRGLDRLQAAFDQRPGQRHGGPGVLDGQNRHDRHGSQDRLQSGAAVHLIPPD